MFKIAAVLLLATGLAGCDVMVSGLSHVWVVERELQTSTGVKPQVGFKWANGRLESVNVSYPRLLEGKPVRELADTVRAAVVKEFNETPRHIVLSFEVGPAGSDKVAQLIH